jgi:glycosyltransferase involved in cell wall biosynthesis
MLALALAADPDVVLCNDWMTLPVGAEVKRRRNVTLVYDSHEYAAKEHIQNWKWRVVSRAAVCAVEKRHIGKADLVLTVSPGIAEALQRDHALPATPTVVRNLPPYIETRAGPPNGRRQILFHGLIRPERGLEELIDSAPAWSFDGAIVVRGYGAQAYLDGLRDRARERDIAERLSIEPFVAPDALISLAAAADIGYLALPATTDHYEFALPNKLFEYLMAGLPVLATPRREIHHVLQSTESGFVAELEPRAIAAALNAVTADDLVRMRVAALSAARRLNWEAERHLLIAAIEAAHRPPSAAERRRALP